MNVSTNKLLIARILFVSYIIIQTIFVIYYIISYIITDGGVASFYGYDYSDWLINYEGGFVRRGLIGQILLWLYNHTHIDIKTAIILLSYTSTLALAFVTYYQFYKHRISWAILPCVFMVGGMFMSSTLWYRRDALMLLMIFFIFYLYRKIHTSDNKRLYIGAFHTMSIITLLTHEASFFCFVPFVALHYYTSLPSHTTHKWARCILFGLPAIITMALVCLCKGNETTAQTIWESWMPYITDKYEPIDWMGQGIQALTWSTSKTFATHFHLNHLSYAVFDISGLPSFNLIPSAILWIIIYITIYYICINSNKIKIIGNEYDNHNNPISQYLPQALIIQFIALLPLFTVLSCDMRRIIIYWVMTSFFIAFMLQDTAKPFSLPRFTPCVNRISNKLTHGAITQKTAFWIICVILIGVPLYGFKFSDFLFSSVLFNTYYVIRHIIPTLL